MNVIPNKEGHSLNERIAAVVGIMVFALLPLFSPLFFWMNLVFPVPVGFVVFRFGSREGKLLVTAAFMLAAVFAAWMGQIPAMLFSGLHLPAGIFLGLSASKKILPWKTGLTLLITLVSGWVLLGVFYAVLEQRNPYTDMLATFEKGIESAEDIVLNDKRIKSEDREIMRTTLLKTRELLPKLFPGGLAVSLVCMVWINFVLCHAFLIKWHDEGSPWGDSAHWRMPDHVVWLGIASGLLVLLSEGIVQMIGKNIGFVLSFLYFFQGLAVMAGMLRRWSMPPILRILIYIFAVFQVHFSFFVAVIGLADIWADFNKIRVSNNIQA